MTIRPWWLTLGFSEASDVWKGGDLGFSVGLFTGLAVICIITLIGRWMVLVVWRVGSLMLDGAVQNAYRRDVDSRKVLW